MKLIPRFTFDGKAEEALNFYCKVFNGQIRSLIRYSDAKDDYDMSGIDEKGMKRIMSSYMQFGTNTISSCDQFPGEVIASGNVVMMDLIITDEKELKRVFNGLSEGGKILQPLAPAAWTPWYGLVTDRFGINWNIMQSI